VLTRERGWFRAVITTVTGMVGWATRVPGVVEREPEQREREEEPGHGHDAEEQRHRNRPRDGRGDDGATAIEPIVASTSHRPGPRRARLNLPWIVMYALGGREARRSRRPGAAGAGETLR
jgi:hypothetical protein